eukprot:1924243-Ditylum_brightwellii.AAC.1
MEGGPSSTPVFASLISLHSRIRESDNSGSNEGEESDFSYDNDISSEEQKGQWHKGKINYHGHHFTSKRRGKHCNVDLVDSL